MGIVQGEDASILGAAWVTIAREAAGPLVKITPFAASTPARPDGTFAFTGLDPGIYRLCAQLTGKAWLNPCEWGHSNTTVILTSEQIRQGIVLTMKKAATVPIRLDDPQGLLAGKKHTPGADVLIGVGNDAGMFHAVTIVSEDAKGREHSIMIPFGVPIDVVAYSKVFQLGDNAGKSFPASGARIRVNVPPGTQASKVTITVRGLNAP
jgi:hypothetical protein